MEKKLVNALYVGANVKYLDGRIYKVINSRAGEGKVLAVSIQYSFSIENAITLAFNEIEPIDKVRFITPNYKLLFEVKNLEKVRLKNGELRIVQYLDDYHFAFLDEEGEFKNSYHIAQYAEYYNVDGNNVHKI